MRVICAWCGELLKSGKRLTESEHNPQNLSGIHDEISHGICSECLDKLMSTWTLALTERVIRPTKES